MTTTQSEAKTDARNSDRKTTNVIPPTFDWTRSNRIPRSFIRKNTCGTINLSIVVDENGKVLTADVKDSTNDELSEDALNMIKRARFKAATLNGVPIKFGPMDYQVKLTSDEVCVNHAQHMERKAKALRNSSSSIPPSHEQLLAWDCLSFTPNPLISRWRQKSTIRNQYHPEMLKVKATNHCSFDVEFSACFENRTKRRCRTNVIIKGYSSKSIIRNLGNVKHSRVEVNGLACNILPKDGYVAALNTISVDKNRVEVAGECVSSVVSN